MLTDNVRVRGRGATGHDGGQPPEQEEAGVAMDLQRLPRGTHRGRAGGVHRHQPQDTGVQHSHRPHKGYYIIFQSTISRKTYINKTRYKRHRIE